MGLGKLQWRTGRRLKLAYLLPRPVWTLGSQVERAQRNRNGLEGVGELKGSTGNRKAGFASGFGEGMTVRWEDHPLQTFCQSAGNETGELQCVEQEGE